MPKHQGPPTEPTLYLLHGWAVDQFNQQKWQPLMASLAKYHIKTVFLPIPGLTAPLHEVWDLSDFVTWLGEVLPAQQPVYLLGHSFGGQLAAAFAAQNPHRVTKLILIDSSGVRDHSFFATAKRTVFWVMAKIGKLLFRSEVWRKFLYKVAREQDYLNAPPLLRRSMSNVLEAEIDQDLPKISCPTLIIWGEQDRVTPLWLGNFFHHQIRNSQLVMIKNARHSPQFTHVAEVAEQVAKFVK